MRHRRPTRRLIYQGPIDERQTELPIREPKLANSPDADEVAVGALAYLAGDEERLGRFLDVTGLRPDTLRRAAAESGFLASVLEYVTADERLLLGVAENLGLSPEGIVRAQATLSRSQTSEEF